MNRVICGVFVFCAAGAGLWPLFSAAPVPVADVAPLEDLVFEIDARIAELDQLLESEPSYAGQKEGAVRRAFGVLACVGQAVAEHADRAKAPMAATALRDAARRFRPDATYEEAKDALAAVRAARTGEADEDDALDYDWAQLINMHVMMEEIETRSGRLVRIARRPRGSVEESAHASTIAVLAVAMMADTHEVKNDADVPQWREMAREYQQLMTQLGAAIRAKDRSAAGRLLQEATRSCDRCHEKFRDE